MVYLNKVLDYVIGFRSRNRNCMILASFYYALAFLFAMCAEGFRLFTLCLLWSIPFIVYAIKDFKITKDLKSLLTLPICAVVLIISTVFGSSPQLEAIKISPENINFTELEQTQDIKRVAVPEGASFGDAELISDKPDIVATKGDTLIAKAEGSSKVYVKSKNKDVTSNIITVTVVSAKAEKERQQTANNLIAQIDAIDENNLLQNYSAIKQIDEQLNNADPKIQALVANKDKFTALRDKCYEQKKQADEAEAKAKAEAEERARIAAEQEAQRAAEQEARQAAAAAAAAQAPTEQSDNSATVYIGATGSKYHRQNCRTLKNGGHAISLSNAQARGYTACKVCRP